MSVLQKVLLVLIIIGAINWGLVGFFRFDLVAAIFGGQLTLASRAIYAIIGLAGLGSIPLLFVTNKHEIPEQRAQAQPQA